MQSTVKIPSRTVFTIFTVLFFALNGLGCHATADISGVVLTEDGDPLPDSLVTIHDANRPEMKSLHHSHRTDSQGRFHAVFAYSPYHDNAAFVATVVAQGYVLQVIQVSSKREWLEIHMKKVPKKSMAPMSVIDDVSNGVQK